MRWSGPSCVVHRRYLEPFSQGRTCTLPSIPGRAGLTPTPTPRALPSQGPSRLAGRSCACDAPVLKLGFLVWVLLMLKFCLDPNFVRNKGGGQGPGTLGGESVNPYPIFRCCLMECSLHQKQPDNDINDHLLATLVETACLQHGDVLVFLRQLRRCSAGRTCRSGSRVAASQAASCTEVRRGAASRATPAASMATPALHEICFVRDLLCVDLTRPQKSQTGQDLSPSNQSCTA